MSFKGDVAQIPLSNILQALALNGQEGVLTLETPACQRRLRILPQGIRLLNYQDNPPDILKSIVLKEKLLTEAQLQNTLSTWIPGATYAGDFLILHRILTPEIITSRILHHIENIILQLVVMQDLHYEFDATLDGTPYELFNPDTLGADLVLSTNAVLMEALRRDDEMQSLKAVIPSAHEIFTIADKRGLSAKNLDVNPGFLKEVKPFLTGEHSVARITEQTTLSSYEVHQTIHSLLKHNLVRPLTLEEKRKLADKLKTSLRIDNAMEVLRSIIASEPTDHASRLKLIGLLEKSKTSSADLPQQYLELGSLLADNEPARALGYLQRGLEKSPGDLALLEKLFDIYRQTGDHANAVQVARSLAVATKQPASSQKAIALLYKIINFYPHEPALFHQLADAHLHAQDLDTAVSCLKTVAELYESNQDQNNLRKTYELIARLKPSEKNKLKRLPQLLLRSTFNVKKFLRKAILLMSTAALLSTIAVVGVNEYKSRLAFAAVISSVSHQKQSGHLDIARQALQDFERKHAYSTQLRELHNELAEVNKLIKQREESQTANNFERQHASNTNFARAKLALNGNDYIKADELIKQVDIKYLDADRAADVTNILATITNYFSKAQQLLQKADVAESNQDYERSHALRKELLLRYPYSRAAVGLLLPVRLETNPSDAELTVENQIVGKTPILLRLPPKKLPAIRIVRPGYSPYDSTAESMDSKSINPLDSHTVIISLHKTTHWTFPVNGSIEGFPATVHDNVYFGTRTGTVYGVKQDTGALLWEYTIPDRMDFAGGVLSWRNQLYFGCFDGRLYVLDALTGKLVNRPEPLTPEHLPIKTAASSPSEGGVVAVNCDKRVIATYNLTTGRPAWSINASNGHFLGQPQASAGNLYVVTSNGELSELEHESGKLLRRIQLGSELGSPGVMANGHYYFVTLLGKFAAMDLSRQSLSWSYDCGDQINCSPIVDGDWAIAVAASGRLYCLNISGELKWVASSNSNYAPEFSGMVFRNNLILGSEAGLIQCFDLWSGSLRWTYKTTGNPDKTSRRFLAGGSVGKSRLYIGSEDNTFYCLSLD